ncbi:Ppx/GppA phosphatase family protein [Pseudomaricurvus sp.]|uniref:Ppx/GppA phosphatase family protein n=1 Tax=Pseudomaricurvus sp. TaxID=2004510 RepID=UPI003F6C2813
MKNPHPTHFAAIDLGSNSFHLLISEWSEGQLHEVARQKVMVQLARGVDEQHNLSAAALERARSCLEDFSTLLQQYPNALVRTIGTQALRQCNNLAQFLSMAEPILGGPVEIISGQQEANFVYQGVQHSLPATERKQPILVVDIGGASTELIIGRGNKISQSHSFALGCVDLANRYFPLAQQPTITPESLNQAYQYSCQTLAPLQETFSATHWQQALGASGTMRVILDLLPNDAEPSIITRQQLKDLLENLRQQGKLSEIIPDSLRWDVLPAGLALLQAIFDTFTINQLTVSAGSIKEGVMLDSIREMAHKDDKNTQ